MGSVISASYGGGWGNFIIIKSGDLYYLYAHLDKIPSISGSISEGDVIGSSGDSQTSGEPHLHLEVRRQLNDEGYNNMLKLDIEIYLGTKFDNYGNIVQSGC